MWPSSYSYSQPLTIPYNNGVYQPYFWHPPVNSFYDDPRLPWIEPQLERSYLEKKKTRAPSPIHLPPLKNKKKFYFIPHKLYKGFTSNEEIIIENALQIVSQRLFKPEVLENMYQVCKKNSYFLDSGVWERSQLETHRGHHRPNDLLEYQLTCLRIKAENDEFPMIHITSFSEQTATSGSGVIGCISCISSGSKFIIDGEFQIKLNRYHLNGTNRDAKDPLRWAGVIVHELLHNLGHRHKVGDYTDAWQINAFEHCFLHDGRYFP